MEISWLTAFLDLPASGHDAGTAFWTAASGQVVSATRGDDDEFTTLLPIGGDDYLRIQRLGDGPARIHLDLHASDLAAAGARAEGLGAKLVGSHEYSTYLSPGGLPFCIVRQPNSVRTTPARWTGHASLVDQVCLDIPSRRYDEETAFWAALLELDQEPSRLGSAFASLVRPDGQPLRVLLHRLDDEEGDVRAHLDLATDNRAEEVRRLIGFGASLVREETSWTTLRDPAGLEFCVTDRDPVTGLLAMTRVDAPLAGDEASTLLGFLAHQRDTLRMKAAGLSADQLNATLAPSSMTLGGMLKHLALVESSWFSQDLLDEPLMAPFATADWEADRDWEWHSAADDAPEVLLALLDRACAASDRIIATVLADDGLDRLSVRGSAATGERFSLRWIVVHMIEEYARHNGHADLLRESIDGAVGE